MGPEIDVVKTEGVVIEDMGDSAPPRWRNRTGSQYLYLSLAKALFWGGGWKLLTKDIISHPPAVSNSCAINFNLGLAPIAYRVQDWSILLLQRIGHPPVSQGRTRSRPIIAGGRDTGIVDACSVGSTGMVVIWMTPVVWVS